MTKRIFLTGVTGLAGHDVLAEFVHQGNVTTALIRKPVQIPGCRTVVGDLSNPASFAADVEASDAIVHLASSRSFGQQEVFGDITGSAGILDHWKRGTFVSLSTGSIYAGSQAPLREDMPVGIQSGYALGKLCEELQLRVATGAGNRGPGIALRPGIFLGAGPRRNDRQVLGTLYERCRSGAKFFFRSEEGLESFGACFIGTQDFSRAVSQALMLELPGVYNVAGGFCTWRQLIEVINRSAGTRAEVTVSAVPPSGPGEFALPQARRFLDTTKFCQATKFAPQQTLEQLVEDYLRAEQATGAKRN